MTEVLRAGCFVGDKEDPNNLCQKPDCKFEKDCMWKKDKVVPGLGSFINSTEARPKVR